MLGGGARDSEVRWVSARVRLARGRAGEQLGEGQKLRSWWVFDLEGSRLPF